MSMRIVCDSFGRTCQGQRIEYLSISKSCWQTPPQKQQSGRSVPPLVPEYAKLFLCFFQANHNWIPKTDSRNSCPKSLRAANSCGLKPKGDKAANNRWCMCLEFFMVIKILWQLQNHFGTPSMSWDTHLTCSQRQFTMYWAEAKSTLQENDLQPFANGGTGQTNFRNLNCRWRTTWNLTCAKSWAASECCCSTSWRQKS